MDVFSITFIVILLFFAIFWFAKGFLRSILSFSQGILSFIIASCTCKPVANLLIKLPFIINSENQMIDWLNSQNSSFSQTIYPNQIDTVVDALKTLSVPIPSFLANTIAQKIEIPETGIVLSEAISFSLLYLLLTIISFILIIILSRIFLFVFKRLIKYIMKSLPTVRKADRIVGLFGGLFFGICIVDIFCFVILGMMSIPLFESVNNYIIAEMQLDTSGFTFAKFMYEHNLLLYLLNL